MGEVSDAFSGGGMVSGSGTRRDPYSGISKGRGYQYVTEKEKSELPSGWSKLTQEEQERRAATILGTYGTQQGSAKLPEGVREQLGGVASGSVHVGTKGEFEQSKSYEPTGWKELPKQEVQKRQEEILKTYGGTGLLPVPSEIQIQQQIGPQKSQRIYKQKEEFIRSVTSPRTSAEYATKFAYEESTAPSWKERPIDWLSYRSEQTYSYFGAKAKESKSILGGTGLIVGSAAFGFGKGFVDIGGAIVHPVRTTKGLVYSVRHPIKTTKEMYGMFKLNPAAFTGELAGQFVAGKIVWKGATPLVSKSRFAVGKGLGRITGRYVSVEESGITFTPSTTIPISKSKYLKIAGKEKVITHVTQSGEIKGGLTSGKLLLKAVPEGAGGLRKEYKLFSFYRSVTESGKPAAYLGYTDIAPTVRTMPAKYVLFKPRTRVLVEKIKISGLPKEVIKKPVGEINIYIQKQMRGTATLAPENIVGISREGQVVTPTAYKELGWKGTELQFKRPQVIQKVARVFGTELGERYTYIKQKPVIPKLIKGTRLESLYSKSFTKYRRVELIDVKTIPVSRVRKQSIEKGIVSKPRVVTTKKLYSSYGKRYVSLSEQGLKSAVSSFSKSYKSKPSYYKKGYVSKPYSAKSVTSSRFKQSYGKQYGVSSRKYIKSYPSKYVGTSYLSAGTYLGTTSYNVGRTGYTMGVGTYNITAPTTKKKVLLPPTVKLESKKKKTYMREIFKPQPRRYLADVTSRAFGLRGKIPMKRGGGFTGLEQRKI